jgi:valyl-tRNA synthetase
MNKTYTPADHESKIYRLWEKSNAFKPAKNKKPYTILMPPPNANASLHSGHAMYTVDDIIIRFKRMQGYSALWQPGMDHAGFETQFVYEKHLRKQGKSRLDFDRQTLYQNVYDFVQENSGLIYDQFKRLGFSADWSRSVFTLDSHVIKRTFETFKQMESEGKVYRDNYIVNYCVHCGTSLAELEVKHIECTDPLYYIRYPLVENPTEYVVVATVRPEPIFIDKHLAVNPEDKKNKHLIGKQVKNPITDEPMDIIGDEYVDPDFGTGVVKLTPAHDANDFQVAKKLNLKFLQAIDWRGKMIDVMDLAPNAAGGSGVHGMKVKDARKKIVNDLQTKKLIEKIDEHYVHSVITCYKCGHDLEPLTIPNWFIKIDELKKSVIQAVKNDRVKFYPKKFKKQMLQWLEIMHDWPISRQIVWGIRIPVWYKIDRNRDNLAVSWIDKQGKIHAGRSLKAELKKGVDLTTIEQGLQEVVAASDSSRPDYVVSLTKPQGGEYIQETDTFDTWFSSGQWPLVTLQDNEFSTRLPTDFIGTLHEILKFWVSRMIMFSLYLKNEVPFKNVYLWSMVADKHGLKMSKSKGNVVNPMEFVDKYGADALRFSLMYGIPAGSKVILSEDKVRGMRNFANKLWNIGRFIEMSFDQLPESNHPGGGTPLKNINKSDSPGVDGNNNNIPWLEDLSSEALAKEDKQIIKKLNTTIKKTTIYLDRFQLNEAAQLLYDFIWHDLADTYIEAIKNRLRPDENSKLETQNSKLAALSCLRHVYLNTLKLLHPFMPFVTETIWQELKHLRHKPDQLLITSSWSQVKK